MYYQSLVFLLCALYGSVFTIGKITLEYSSPLFITGSRMLLAGVLLLLFQFFFHRPQCYVKKNHILPMCIIGLTNVYLANALEFWGLQFMESGKTCFLYSFAPIATALLSYFWFSEKITWLKCLGLTIGVLGFIPVLIARESTEDFSGRLGFFSYAELAVLGAALCTAIGWMTMRVMVKNQNYSPIMANATSMCVGGAFALVHSLFAEVWLPIPVTDFSEFIGPFLLLMLISNIIAYNLNSYLLKHFTATYMSLTGLTQPVFAAIFGYIFLQEVMHEYFWISILAVMLGLYIYYQQELKQGLTPRSAVKSVTKKKKN